MSLQVICTEAAPKAIGPYSQAVKANGFIFASGQIPIDPSTGQLIYGSISDQTACVFNNLKAVLKEANSSLENVVKVNVYMRDLADFDEMNKVYAEFFPHNKPARATVQVARLPRDVAIEIDLIAVANN
jgi:2-iminobutanoate/2-iminopropanoate deaminase